VGVLFPENGLNPTGHPNPRLSMSPVLAMSAASGVFSITVFLSLHNPSSGVDCPDTKTGKVKGNTPIQKHNILVTLKILLRCLAFIFSNWLAKLNKA
jgi:hypothetical protein